MKSKHRLSELEQEYRSTLIALIVMLAFILSMWLFPSVREWVRDNTTGDHGDLFYP